MGSQAGCMGLHLGARYDEHRDAQLDHDTAQLRVHQAGEPRVGVRYDVRPLGLLVDGEQVDRQGELDAEAAEVDQAEEEEPLVQREATAAVLRLDEVVQWRHSLHGPALEARLVRIRVVCQHHRLPKADHTAWRDPHLMGGSHLPDHGQCAAAKPENQQQPDPPSEPVKARPLQLLAPCVVVCGIAPRHGIERHVGHGWTVWHGWTRGRG
jgi:hypothetical protein